MKLLRSALVVASALFVSACGPEDTRAPSHPSTPSTQSGKTSCAVAENCPSYACECTGQSAPVNSRQCVNQQCADSATACNTGCKGFGASWTGRILTAPSASSTSSTSSGAPGSACADQYDCNALTCACADGAVLSVRDCYNKKCSAMAVACEDACYDTGHGGWDPS